MEYEIFGSLNTALSQNMSNNFKVPLLPALIRTESRLSEILSFRILLIALEPIGPSKFCKKYDITQLFMAIKSKDIFKKIVCFHGCGEG